jgi:peroxiredoxin
VILAQACERIAHALAQRAIEYPFPLLCDANRAAVRQYGVWDPIGLASFNTAHPACFLVDSAERRIRYEFVGSSQFERAPLDRILDAVGH